MTKDCRLYLVRHADPEPPRTGIYLGQMDVPLSALGWRQARRLRDRLRDTEIEAAFSSDLTRSIQTAQTIIDGRGLDLTIIPGLREISFGDWEGRRYEEIEAENPALLQSWMDDACVHCPPGAETLMDLDKRVRESFDQILATGVSSALVVTHGGPLQVLICDVLGMTYHSRWSLFFDRGGMSVVDIRSGEWTLTSLNDTCHIEDLKS